MTTAYRPNFSYDPAGLTAHQIRQHWLTEHRYLPVAVSEPEKVADLIEDLIRQEMALNLIGPPCTLHGRGMVLLGEMGQGWRTVIRKLTIKEWMGVGRRGTIMVRNGIYRCPTPGCYIVASPEVQW